VVGPRAWSLGHLAKPSRPSSSCSYTIVAGPVASSIAKLRLARAGRVGLCPGGDFHFGSKATTPPSGHHTLDEEGNWAHSYFTKRAYASRHGADRGGRRFFYAGRVARERGRGLELGAPRRRRPSFTRRSPAPAAGDGSAWGRLGGERIDSASPATAGKPGDATAPFSSTTGRRRICASACVERRDARSSRVLAVRERGGGGDRGAVHRVQPPRVPRRAPAPQDRGATECGFQRERADQ